MPSASADNSIPGRPRSGRARSSPAGARRRPPPTRARCPVPPSECSAAEEAVSWAETRRRREVPLLDLVLRRKPQHAFAQRVRVGLVAQLFAARSIDEHHVLDVARDGGGTLLLGQSAGYENQEGQASEL